MRKNIIFKSILRQLIQTILLSLLVGVAAFFFVSRVAEYHIVDMETRRIGAHYRSIGYFMSPRWESGISDAAEFLDGLDSPYIEFINRSRYGFATMHDHYNIYTTRFSGSRGARGIHDRYAVFYGELERVHGEFVHWQPRTILIFRVDKVVAGYPEWLAPGTSMPLNWSRAVGASLELRNELFHIGQRYFVRANIERPPNWTMQREHILVPVNPMREPGEAVIWAIPVEPGEEVDFSCPELAPLLPMVELMNYNHRGMRVRTSVDMTAMPQTQRGVEMWNLREGRWFNYEDYVNENPVAVIHWHFAHDRGLEIGDTFTLSLWDYEVRPARRREEVNDVWGIRSDDSEWENAREEEITVEVVGTFAYAHMAPGGFQAKDIWLPSSIVPEWFGEDTLATNFTYSFVLTSHLYEEAFLESYGDILWEFGSDGFLYQFKFFEHNAEAYWESVEPIMESLRLNVALFIGLFVLTIILIIFLYLRARRRDVAILRALGCPRRQILGQFLVPVFILWFPMIILGSGLAREVAQGAALETLTPFLEAGDYEVGELLLDMVWLGQFAAITFAVILLGVIIGAIRAIHRPVLEMLQGEVAKANKKANKKGSFENQDVESEKQTVEEILAALRADVAESISMRSVAMELYSITQSIAELPRTLANRRRGMRRNTRRRILRTPLKSILVVSVAFLSVIAFGWLQNAINENDAEIERLWSTTIVEGEIHPTITESDEVYTGMKHIIAPPTVDQILETGFVEDFYLEMGYELAYYVLPMPDGSFPEEPFRGWSFDELYDQMRHRLFAVSDLDMLVERNTDPLDEFGRQRRFTIYRGGVMYPTLQMRVTPLEITLQEGFDPAVFGRGFQYDFDMTIPVLLPEEMMERYNLELGGRIFISHPFHQRIAEHPFITPPRNEGDSATWSLIRQWVITGEIAGVYTGGVHQPFAHHAIIIPYGIVPSIRDALPRRQMGRTSNYNTVRIFMNPARNRETEEFRAIMENMIRLHRGPVHLTFTLWDEELLNVIQPLEQNLELLHLLYPIVLVVSLLIGIGLTLLLMFQNMKDAAVMRMLGVTKTQARSRLIKEQLLITGVGLLLGAVGLTFIVGGLDVDIRSILYIVFYFIAGLVGSTIGAVVISNREPLELLQVKE